MDEDAVLGLVLISDKGLVEGRSIETEQSRTNSAPVTLQEGQIVHSSGVTERGETKDAHDGTEEPKAEFYPQIPKETGK